MTELQEDLRNAVSMGAVAQNAIQHADTKAAVLLTGLVGLVALSANQPGLAGVAAQTGTAATAWMLVSATAIMTGTAGAGWHLGRCILPRLNGPDGATGNRFALPDLGAHRRPDTPGPMSQQRDEAWAAAEVLAVIAVRKYCAIRTSLPWVAVAAIGSIGWWCLAATIGGQ
jgi:hypothetical protein